MVSFLSFTHGKSDFSSETRSKTLDSACSACFRTARQKGFEPA
jgi:hypothetical protein